MTAPTTLPLGNLPSTATAHHQLRFISLHNRGRAFSIPCDASGKVDLDLLTAGMRTAYFGARAMVGRDYSCPTVEDAVA